jgi:hypothetical protein
MRILLLLLLLLIVIIIIIYLFPPSGLVDNCPSTRDVFRRKLMEPTITIGRHLRLIEDTNFVPEGVAMYRQTEIVRAQRDPSAALAFIKRRRIIGVTLNPWSK